MLNGHTTTEDAIKRNPSATSLPLRRLNMAPRLTACFLIIVFPWWRPILSLRGNSNALKFQLTGFIRSTRNRSQRCMFRIAPDTDLRHPGTNPGGSSVSGWPTTLELIRT